ncbi:hypothetical protein BKA80DRAFT_283661 [Phyllosticta citrichinensis]
MCPKEMTEPSLTAIALTDHSLTPAGESGQLSPALPGTVLPRDLRFTTANPRDHNVIRHAMLRCLTCPTDCKPTHLDDSQQRNRGTSVMRTTPRSEPTAHQHRHQQQHHHQLSKKDQPTYLHLAGARAGRPESRRDRSRQPCPAPIERHNRSFLFTSSASFASGFLLLASGVLLL